MEKPPSPLRGVFIDYASLPPMFAHNEGFDDYPSQSDRLA
jgi:hypothetical protein